MLNKLRSNQNQKGFTLIELMIVIAIIGILAAIAMPQFMAYRMRGYHSTALSDVRNWSATEAAMMQDGACYGISTFAEDLNNPTGPGAAGVVVGALIVGGRSAEETVMATADTDGCAMQGTRNDGQANAINFAFPVGVGDGVKLRADVSSSDNAPEYNDSFLLWSEHQKGIRAFAVDSDISTTVFFTEDDDWSGQPTDVFNFNTVDPVIGEDDFAGELTGAVKITGWTVLK